MPMLNAAAVLHGPSGRRRGPCGTATAAPTARGRPRPSPLARCDLAAQHVGDHEGGVLVELAQARRAGVERQRDADRPRRRVGIEEAGQLERLASARSPRCGCERAAVAAARRRSASRTSRRACPARLHGRERAARAAAAGVDRRASASATSIGERVDARLDLPRTRQSPRRQPRSPPASGGCGTPSQGSAKRNRKSGQPAGSPGGVDAARRREMLKCARPGARGRREFQRVGRTAAIARSAAGQIDLHMRGVVRRPRRSIKPALLRREPPARPPAVAVRQPGVEQRRTPASLAAGAATATLQTSGRCSSRKSAKSSSR